MTIRDNRPQKYAAVASTSLTMLFAIYIGSTLRTGLGVVLDVLIALGVDAVAVAVLTLLFALALQLARLVKRRPDRYVALLLASGVAFLLLLLAFEVPLTVALPIGGALVAAQIMLGLGLGLWRRDEGWTSRNAPLVLGGLVLDVAIVVLLVSPGSKPELRGLPLPEVGSLAADSPATPGPYEVRALTYGSGTDRHRPEFGEAVSLRTEAVDMRPFVSLGGLGADVRRRYWGFGLDQFPLNGRVWQPEGEGPFPLVLIVHGNDFMTEPADTGYAYLGELLASRGFIAVSVDQTFFGSYTIGRMRQENDGRAVVLLEHLRQWQDWNQDESSPFYGRVDLERIGLVGHSRGGEAAAIAALFAELDAYPDDPSIPLDYDFEITSIVAIAPSYGQYQPAGENLELEGVNYLLLQGAHDADTGANLGSRMYNRVHVAGDDPAIKAAVTVYRANHSQFNTAWGGRDGNIPVNWLLNQRPLLGPEEQRRIAEVLVSAFLEATLHDDPTYAAILRDVSQAGDWLPDTYYATRYQDNTFQGLASYEEDEDQTTGSVAGVELVGQGVDLDEVDVKFRYGGSQHTRAVSLPWEGADGEYTVRLPDGFASASGLTGADWLAFDIADRYPFDRARGLTDISLELVDAAGDSARTTLSQHATLLPPLPVRFTKWPPWETDRFGEPTEAVFQTVTVPLSAFEGVDPANITQVRFLFDGSSPGVVLLDEIGFLAGGSD